MKMYTHVIADAVGIHARPASVLMKAASSFCSTVTLSKGEKTVGVKQFFALMGLGVKHGDTIVLRVEGTDEEQAMERLQILLKKEF